MSVPAIRIEGLSKHFQHGNTSPAVLENLTLDVAQGEFLVLLGPSGCGKSTLLRILAGLSVQDRGTVRFSHAAPKRGMVFQSYSAFEWLSVEDNVAFGLKLAGVPRNTRRERARQLLDRVGLAAYARSWPAQLSGGMQQRLAIARSLATQPDLLLMDEPFGALDTFTRTSMQRFLADLWLDAKTTIVFVTHDIDEAIALADRIVVLAPHPGRIHRIVPVDLPRPRGTLDPDDADWVALRRALRASLNEVCERAGDATGETKEAGVTALA